MITIKSKREIELMQEACKITALTYEYIEKIIKPGMSTLELDHLAEKFIKEHGGIPAQKGYPSGVRGVPNFPGTLCISINDVVIHGIPSRSTVLKDGDIVSVDVGAYYNGYHGDNAYTFCVGEVSDEAKKLLDVTKKGLYAAVEAAVPGNRIGDVSSAVENTVAPCGYGIVRQFVGHGVGKNLHEDPEVPNFGKAGRGARLMAGMVIAIEPMINQYSEEVDVMSDGWTVKTVDGGLSAHFEHTIAITNDGPLILTKA